MIFDIETNKRNIVYHGWKTSKLVWCKVKTNLRVQLSSLSITSPLPPNKMIDFFMESYHYLSSTGFSFIKILSDN